MSQSLDAILRDLVLKSDDERYCAIGLPVRGLLAAAGVIAQIGDPFVALIADANEITLIIPESLVDDFRPRLQEMTLSDVRYRLITADTPPLDPQLVGFFARLSAALAQAGVPILAFSAYSRDHLFVPSDQFDAALTALQRLRA